MCNTIQLWEIVFQRKPPSPRIMAEFNRRAITQLKADKMIKHIPSLLDTLPKANPIRPLYITRTPTPPHTAIFSVHYPSPKSIPLRCIPPQPLPQQSLLKRTKSRMPNPPFWSGSQALLELTRWYLNSFPTPPHRKSLCNYSIHWATLILEDSITVPVFISYYLWGNHYMFQPKFFICILV